MKFNGQVVTAQVMDHNEKEVFAQYEGVTLAIDRLELPTLPEIIKIFLLSFNQGNE